MGTVSTLTVLIKGQNTVTPAATAASSSLSKLGITATKTGSLVGDLGSQGQALLKGSLVLGAIAATKALFDMGAESERVNAQTVAGLKSTGSAANVTLGQVQSLATGIQNYSGISDEAVQTGENMLLTFRNVSNEVGKGNDIFNQASVAAADMATKMAGGATPSAEAMQTAALKLGKALNDPIAGMGALSRVGVQFTAAQKSQITTMVQAGDTMGAQKVILAELTAEFGGSAKALGSTFAGQFNIIKETVGNALESVVVGLFKVVSPLLQVAAFVIQLATASGALIPIILAMAAAWGVYTIVQAAAAAATAATGIAIEVALAPFLIAGAAIAIALVAAFKLVQAGMSALSGGWSKMGGVMKAVLIATAPLWLPIVAAIKLVQVGIKVLVGAFNIIKNAVSSFAVGAANLWNAFLDGIGPVGDALREVGNLLNIFGDIAAANAMTASAEMRSFGLSVVLVAQQGAPAIAEMGRQLTVLRTNLQAVGQGAEWTKMMTAGLASIDNALKSGNISAADAQRAYMAWGQSLSQAQQRTNGLTAALQKTAQFTVVAASITQGASTRISAAMDQTGKHVKLTADLIVKSMRQAAMAATHFASNQSKVAARFQQGTGMSADAAKTLVNQLSSEFGDKAPQILALMAKSSNKQFASFAKSALSGRQGYEEFTKGVTSGTKSAASGAKTTEGLAKSTAAVAPAATKAAAATTKLGSSVQSGVSKVSAMTTQIAKLGSELNGLPKSIRIDVTVNVTKTGQQLGGIVPGLARGGISSMPLTEVGETGREFAALPPGTRVYSHAETMGLSAAMSGMGGGGAGQMSIAGKLRLVDGEAYIEGVVLDVLDDGSALDHILTKAMRRP